MIKALPLHLLQSRFGCLYKLFLSLYLGIKENHRNLFVKFAIKNYNTQFYK